MSATGRTESIYLVFVCSGNICRSPMGEIIVRDAIEDAGLGEDVLIKSCGIGAWHVGQDADERAQRELAQAGHDPQHTAAQLGPEHDDATLYVAMDNGHIRELRAQGISAERIRLMRSFDPDSPEGAEVDDPYYGTAESFARTRREIEAATPGVVEWVRTLLDDASER
ncbi:low molecular weight phosphotyrosine protein phosphatase [Corynebacterium sp. TAE3-ERU12]|uniref:low molecular weight protein-tyrosine-phosphatase n=1 Tax=Corynebacterium sp. TAE3-ERU12 TaxID=2849491 RepID=UPI001C461AEE|nr:low molecular weight protein-tyrosine-phosphatase [Corynebacterium sp. TAE3-ERU12]MBV7295805.1 low molecular weight phosphotyrosine protein phosphatase [Corynebacterium sp. TAE3-ERU12]